MSPSSVSRISKELDENVHEFLNRPIESRFPYLFVDESYFKVKDRIRYVSKALLVIAGVREDGYREILGARIADCENEEFWSGSFDDTENALHFPDREIPDFPVLKERGLDGGVQLVVSDGHKGIHKAVETSFIGASWQMCLVHLIRAVMRNIPKKHQKQIAELLKEVLINEAKVQKMADNHNDRGSRKAANTIERFLPNLMNFKAFPKSHWKKIRTTNGMERINKELKRRSRVVGAFHTFPLEWWSMSPTGDSITAAHGCDTPL